jgi:myo-inositol-1(or 4)-monophosphatase
MDKEINILLDAMRAAGDAVLQLQNKGFSVERKANNDLVTQADLLVNEMIAKTISSHFPNDGWLSEESCDHPLRLTKERVWVIDPIDGTIEFAKGTPEYAISVALVINSEPVVAAVFNPAKKELFHAQKNRGAWLNGNPIRCDEKLSEKLLLLASRSEYKRGEWQSYEKYHQVQQVGSIAYKLALVAAGKAHATFSLGPKNEWDVAAGVLLVREAGGVVSDQYQRRLLFNQPNVLQDSIVATSSHCHERVFNLIKQNGI